MAIVIMLVIFAASSTPGNDLPDLGGWDLFAKKGGHMLGYALLAVGYLRGLAEGKVITSRRGALAVLLAVLYAVSDELHQHFVPGRDPSPYDVIVDSVGAVLGAGIWSRLKRHSRPVE